MDDRFDHLIGERRLQRAHVGKVEFVKGEQAAMRRLQRGDPVALERDRIIVVYVVDPDDGKAPGEKLVGDVHANKARHAGYQYGHALLLPLDRRGYRHAGMPSADSIADGAPHRPYAMMVDRRLRFSLIFIG